MKEAIDLKPAFLTRNEFEWLQGKIELSASYQRKIKSDIRKKLRVFQALELPLLTRTGFITVATTNFKLLLQPIVTSGKMTPPQSN